MTEQASSVRTRKRSVALAGLSLWSSTLMVQSSGFQQHTVPIATRNVSYLHADVAKPPFDPFWIPSHVDRENAKKESGSQRVEARRMHLAGQTHQDVFAHVLADASVQHPDPVFRRLRRRIRDEEGQETGVLSRYLRMLESNDTDGLSTMGEDDQSFVNGDIALVEGGPNLTDFNVSSGVEYNVSVVVEDGQGKSTTNDNATVVFTDSERTKNNTNSSQPLRKMRPIRIRAYLAEIEGAGRFLTDDEHVTLLEDIVRPALLSWSAALRVDPVIGNLTVDANQLIDGVSCGPGVDSGLPTAPVPSEHLTDGVPGADLIVYLNIGFAGSNRTLLVPPELSGGANFSSSSGKNATKATNSSVVSKSGKKVMISAPGCSGEYLAASAFCSTDQFDRPTAAILHICVGNGFFNKSALHKNIMTVQHELGHALGFNSVSLAHFRRRDGTPITTRVNGSVPLTEVECTGPRSDRSRANVTLPSPEILRFRTVRGGVRVADVVTPSVVQVARNHFACQRLPGAELESGEFLPLAADTHETSCIGNHWERRLFKSDLMNPVIDDLEFSPRLSTINLAYFADSGWYQVDLSRASLAAGWGRGAGCEFVEDTCIGPDGLVPTSFEDFFCNDSPALDIDGFAVDVHGCTPDLSRKASCAIGKYTADLPGEYQYFNLTYGSNVGGSDPYMDYCPVFSGFTNGLCADPKNEALIKVDRMERFGERNSRCVAGRNSYGRTALCLRIACAVEDRSFHVQVDGMWMQCVFKDQVLLSANGDRVICPDPVRVCPTFYCERDCLGTMKICDFDKGMCVCNSSSCMPEHDATFYDPTLQQEDDSLPDEDSPLSDYYVPTSRVLKNERRRLNLSDWAIAFISLACAVFVAAGFFLVQRRKTRSQSGPPDDGPDNASSPAVNPNKDKMMASIVVDLRMNGPNRSDILDGRSSETDLSMTDTDGGGTHVTDLQLEPEDGFFGFGDLPEVHVDPLAPPPVVRRRNVHDTR